MSSLLYFDADRLKRGDFFKVIGEIVSEEGHPYELDEWVGRGGTRPYSVVARGQRGKSAQSNF